MDKPEYVAVDTSPARTIIAKLCTECPRYHFYSDVSKSTADAVADALNGVQ